MKQTRLIIHLLKAPISDITEGGFTIRIGAMYGSPTTIRVPTDTRHLDLRDGDLITVYTEVMLKQPEGNA